MRSTAFFQLWSRILHPAIDRCMIYLSPSFSHNLFKIVINESIMQIPSHTEKKHVSLEVTPFEQVLLCHEWSYRSFSFTLTDQLYLYNTAPVD